MVHNQHCGYWCLGAKQQTISTHSADYTFIVLDQFHTEILQLWETILENEITFWEKVNTQMFKG